MDIFVTKHANCWYTYAAIVRGQRIHMTYQGYTKREARKRFIQELKNEVNKKLW